MTTIQEVINCIPDMTRRPSLQSNGLLTVLPIVKKLQELKDELRKLSGGNETDFEEILSSLGLLKTAIEAIHIPDPIPFPDSVNVRLHKKDLAAFPKPLSSVEVSNLSEIVSELKKLNRDISFPESIEVTSVKGIHFQKEILDLLKHLKYITDDADHPVSVRLSDGDKFIKALDHHGQIISHHGGGGGSPHMIRDMDDILAPYHINDIDDDVSPFYYGFEDKEGKVYLLKETVATGANTYRYFKSNSDYAANWAARASKTYGLFNDVFN
jgi:hypothetical protein